MVSTVSRSRRSRRHRLSARGLRRPGAAGLLSVARADRGAFPARSGTTTRLGGPVATEGELPHVRGLVFRSRAGEAGPWKAPVVRRRPVHVRPPRAGGRACDTPFGAAIFDSRQAGSAAVAATQKAVRRRIFEMVLHNRNQRARHASRRHCAASSQHATVQPGPSAWDGGGAVARSRSEGPAEHIEPWKPANPGLPRHVPCSASQSARLSPASALSGGRRLPERYPPASRVCFTTPGQGYHPAPWPFRDPPASVDAARVRK
jgi:hypothetical protein